MFKNIAIKVFKVALCFGGLALGSWVGEKVEDKVTGTETVKIVDVEQINEEKNEE